MNVRNQYNTRQRSRLLEYMQAVPGEHFTAKDVCDYFQTCGTPIGVATVYRQLERMVEEGLVNKYIIDANSPACFEYVGESGQQEQKQETCFHCKCEKCGKLIHLHCEELCGISLHLKEHHQFLLNPMRTVFYGICESCAKKV